MFRIKRIRRQFAAAERAQSWRRMRRYSHVAECDSWGREWGDGGGFEDPIRLHMMNPD